MATLKKEDLLAKREGDIVVEYWISVPGYEGSVDIRAIRNMGEFDRMQKEQRKLETARDHLHAPELIGKTDEQIAVAVTLTACMVEPELTPGENRLYEDAFTFMDNIGLGAMGIANRISEISGMTEDALKRREADLRKDTFQAFTDVAVRDILKAAAGRDAGDDASGILGSVRLREDQSGGRESGEE